MINKVKKAKYILSLMLVLVSVSLSAQLNTDRLTAIGRNALYFNDYVLSIQYFNQVIKVKPYLAEPYLYRAIAKIQLGDMAGAERDCSFAIQNNPFLPGAYYTRGYVRMQLRQYDKAEEDFSEALIFAPENRTYILLRADARSQLGKYDEAIADIDYLLRREPHDASINFERGVISMAQKDTLAAHKSFSIAVQYDNQNPANWSARGLTNLLLGMENDALLDLTTAINLGSRWPGDYINRGILYYKQHNYRGALADYDKAIELDKTDGQTYYNRGVLRAELGDYNRALDDLSTAIDYEPDNTEMYYQRGVVLLQLGQWQEAISDFDVLIEHYPYFLPSYYLAAQAKTALNDLKGAYIYQQKARDLEKNKDQIMRQQQSVNTNVMVAQSQPQKRDRRKEFSNNAAQNQQDTQEEQRYQSEARGSIQNKYTDVVNEPNIVLSYYKLEQQLRRTNYFYFAVDDFNKSGALPSPLHFTVQEQPLTAEMVNQHFEAIDRFSTIIDQTDPNTISADDLSKLYFARAVEFALVQDYSSAIDDCTKALNLISDFSIGYFCRANWRYKLLEYQRSTGELFSDGHNGKLDFELILRDYDKVISYQPDFSFAYYNKANILCTQKNFSTAIEYYNKAIECDPDFAEAYFNRGLTKIFIDDADAGIQDLSKAGELGIYQAYNLITRLK